MRSGQDAVNRCCRCEAKNAVQSACVPLQRVRPHDGVRRHRKFVFWISDDGSRTTIKRWRVTSAVSQVSSKNDGSPKARRTAVPPPTSTRGGDDKVSSPTAPSTKDLKGVVDPGYPMSIGQVHRPVQLPSLIRRWARCSTSRWVCLSWRSDCSRTAFCAKRSLAKKALGNSP